MFGFKEKKQEEKSPVVLVLDKLNKLFETLDKDAQDYSLIFMQIEDCDKEIKKLPPLYRQKVAFSWDGGVIGMLNMIKMQPTQTFPIVWKTGIYLTGFKTNILNTINALM